MPIRLRAHDYGRYISCLYLESELRQAAFALYAFDNKIRQIQNLTTEPATGEIRIQWWRDVFEESEVPSGEPVARSVYETLKRYDLPPALIERYLSARIFDLYIDTLSDRDALESYLGQTCSGLFSLLTIVASRTQQSLRIGVEKQFTAPNLRSDACGHGGVFVGIVELLKALPSNHRNGRQYFPAELSAHPILPQQPHPKSAVIGELAVAEQGDDRAKFANGEWLRDIENYAMHHHDAAFDNIFRLPAEIRGVFNVLALSRRELLDIVQRGTRLNSPYIAMSRLKLNWILWKSARNLAKDPARG